MQMLYCVSLLDFAEPHSQNYASTWKLVVDDIGDASQKLIIQEILLGAIILGLLVLNRVIHSTATTVVVSSP